MSRKARCDGENENVTRSAVDLDLLRLRDHRVVEHELRLADLGEQRVLEVADGAEARRPRPSGTADPSRRGLRRGAGSDVGGGALPA